MGLLDISALFKGRYDFDPDHDDLDRDFVERLAPFMRAFTWYFRTSIVGVENIPLTGPALMVGNHGLMGVDAFAVFAKVFERTGRLVRGTGEHLLFMDPVNRTIWSKIGAFEGTPENAVKYLKAGHLVNVYPGGARDALKRADRLYKLHWEHAKGFVRVAMTAQVPIILHMGIGSDETYKILGRLRFTGKAMGDEKYEIPLMVGLGAFPLPVKLTYYISEPIELEGGPDDVDDQGLVDHNHKLLWERGQKMLDEGLRKRSSVWLG